jgi:hypothetical protein
MRKYVYLGVAGGLVLGAVWGWFNGSNYTEAKLAEERDRTPIVDCCAEEIRWTETQWRACQRDLEAWKEQAAQCAGEKLEVKR